MSYVGSGIRSALGTADVGTQIKAQVGAKVFSDFKSRASAGKIGKDVFETAGSAAAATGGAIGGAAACVATGVGAAIAPLCGAAGAAIGKYISQKMAPEFEEWANTIADTFDPNKAKVAAARKRIAEGTANASASWQEIQTTDEVMMILAEAVQTLRDQHNKLGLPGNYGWQKATTDLQQSGLVLGTIPCSGKDEFGIPLSGTCFTAPTVPADYLRDMTSTAYQQYFGLPPGKYLSVNQETQVYNDSTAFYKDWLVTVQAAVAAVSATMLAAAAAAAVQNEVAAENLVAYANAVKAHQTYGASATSAIAARRTKIVAGVAALGVIGFILYRKKRKH